MFTVHLSMPVRTPVYYGVGLRLFACLYARLSVWVSVCLGVCVTYVCMPVRHACLPECFCYVCMSESVRLPVRPSQCVCSRTFVHLIVHPSVSPSARLSLRLFVCICLFVYGCPSVFQYVRLPVLSSSFVLYVQPN